MKRRDLFTDFISGQGFRKGWTVFIIAFFLILIIVPTLFIITYAFTDWNAININVLSKPGVLSTIYGAISTSLILATVVTVIDLLFGLPLAWMIVKKKFRGKELLDTRSICL